MRWLSKTAPLMETPGITKTPRKYIQEQYKRVESYFQNRAQFYKALAASIQAENGWLTRNL